jgi:hypothetical protein
MNKILTYTELSQWKKIATFKGSKRANGSGIEKLEVEGNVFRDPKQIANHLNLYFSTIGSNLNKTLNTFSTSIFS